MRKEIEEGLNRRDFLKFASMVVGAGLIAAAPMPKILRGESDENPVGELNDTEIHHLEFIREEEKLARDVYIELYNDFPLPVFANIASSEQRHTDAVARLLAYYKLADPFIDQHGVYTSDYIQFLYDWLTAVGKQSMEQALLVGAFIEEYDILDIWKAESETNEERINFVYQNLYEGSYNHLDGFVTNYEGRFDKIYNPEENYLITPESFDLPAGFVEPDLLTKEQFDEILCYDPQRSRGK
jgi:hypothetical protein